MFFELLDSSLNILEGVDVSVSVNLILLWNIFELFLKWTYSFLTSEEFISKFLFIFCIALIMIELQLQILNIVQEPLVYFFNLLQSLGFLPSYYSFVVKFFSEAWNNNFSFFGLIVLDFDLVLEIRDFLFTLG